MVSVIKVLETNQIVELNVWKRMHQLIAIRALTGGHRENVNASCQDALGYACPR